MAVQDAVTEEIRITSRDAVLAGTLYLPASPGPHPAVVMIHGSGPQTRGWPYDRHALAFVSRGVAALIYDKRGSGESTGEMPAAIDFDLLAADAEAAVELLAGRDDIRRDAIGVLGRSQGAWVAPIVAHRSAHVSFLQLLVGGGVPVMEQNLYATRRALENDGLNDEEIERVLRAQVALTGYFLTAEGREEAASTLAAIRDEEWFGRVPVEVIRRTTAVPPPDWVRSHQDDILAPLRETTFDPTDHLRALDVPVLALLAGEDVLTPTWVTARAIDEHVGAGSEIIIFPAADHTFCLAAPGVAFQPGCDLLPGVEAAMADWIVRATGPGGGGANFAIPTVEDLDLSPPGSLALTTNDWFDFHPVWSPRGDLIAWESTEQETPRIMLAPSDGGAPRTIGMGDHPRWMPDGASILYESDRGGDRTDLFVSDLEGNERRLTSERGNEGGALPSPDGTRVAFLAERGDLWRLRVIDLETGRVTEAPDTRSSQLAPSWAPRGDRVAFMTRPEGNWDVYEWDGTGDEVNPLAATPAVESAPQWISDEELVLIHAFEGTTSLRTMRRSGGGITIRETDQQIDWYVVSRDRTKIAYAVGDGDANRIEVVPVPDGPSRLVVAAAGRNVSPDWSPNGASIVFAANRDGDFDIHVVTVFERKGEDHVYWHLDFTADDGETWRTIWIMDMKR